jgi:AraC-like DNA-binding protein
MPPILPQNHHFSHEQSCHAIEQSCHNKAFISAKDAEACCRYCINFRMRPADDYIISLRINKAKSLLRTTSLTLGEIASRTGFCCQSHLSRTLNARERDGNGSEPQKLQRFRIAPAGI